MIEKLINRSITKNDIIVILFSIACLIVYACYVQYYELQNSKHELLFFKDTLDQIQLESSEKILELKKEIIKLSKKLNK